MPLRIDHHGWQLAFLLLSARRLRSIPSSAAAASWPGWRAAASLTIGLEMLPYIALATGATALRWVLEPGRARAAARLWAEPRPRQPRRDSPASPPTTIARWSAMCCRRSISRSRWQAGRCSRGYRCCASNAGRCASRSRRRRRRLLGAGLRARLPAMPRAGPSICRPSSSGCGSTTSARPSRSTQQNYRIALIVIVALPVAGLIGAALATWRAWATARFAGLGDDAAAGRLLVRAAVRGRRVPGPAAQLLAVPGATWLGWTDPAAAARSPAGAGARAGHARGRSCWSPASRTSMVLDSDPACARQPAPAARQVDMPPTARCPTLPALHPIAHAAQG